MGGRLIRWVILFDEKHLHALRCDDLESCILGMRNEAKHLHALGVDNPRYKGALIFLARIFQGLQLQSRDQQKTSF